MRAIRRLSRIAVDMGHQLAVSLRHNHRVRTLEKLLPPPPSSSQFTSVAVISQLRDEPFFNVFNLFLARYLNHRGVLVYLLKDDGVLNHHDLSRNRNTTHPLVKRSGRFAWYRRLLNRLVVSPMASTAGPGVRYLTYREVVPQKTLTLLLSHKADLSKVVNLPEHVDSSHKRCFGGRPFDPTNSAHVEYAMLSLGNCLVNQYVGAKICRNLNPDLFLCLDGIYSLHGPLMDIMRRYGVGVLAFQPMNMRNRSIRLGEKYPSVYNISDIWEGFLAKYYTPELRQAANAFLAPRVDTSRPDNPDEKELLPRLRALKGRYGKCIGLFPNLTWDGAVKGRDIIFKDLADWLCSTIRWAQNKDVFLLLREHPQSPELYSEYDSVASMLRGLMPEYESMPNVVVIDALNSTSSFKLVEQILDLSVVYNGTMGVEVSYLKYPVIFAGNAPYRNKEVAFEPNSSESYFSMLETLSPASPEFIKQRTEFHNNAIRAVAYEFFYNTYYCPIMPEWRSTKRPKEKYWGHWDLDFNGDPKKHERWQRTLDRILHPIRKSRNEPSPF